MNKKILVTPDDILNSFTKPVEIIKAPGSGKSIVIDIEKVNGEPALIADII